MTTEQPTGSRDRVANHPGSSLSNSLPVSTGVITLVCLGILLLVALVADKATSRELPASRQAVSPVPEQAATDSEKPLQAIHTADYASDHPARQGGEHAAAAVAAVEDLSAYKQWQASMRDSFQRRLINGNRRSLHTLRNKPD
jgi:hypothetical protein